MCAADPPDLKEHVDEVARTFTQRYGFTHRSYVPKVGRGRQIELYFVVPKDLPAKPLEQWDRIRDEVSRAVGDDTGPLADHRLHDGPGWAV